MEEQVERWRRRRSRAWKKGNWNRPFQSNQQMFRLCAPGALHYPREFGSKSRWSRWVLQFWRNPPPKKRCVCVGESLQFHINAAPLTIDLSFWIRDGLKSVREARSFWSAGWSKMKKKNELFVFLARNSTMQGTLFWLLLSPPPKIAPYLGGLQRDLKK